MTARPLVIHKFGGTSLRNSRRISAAAAILRRQARRERVVIVASATAGTTNALLAAAADAEQGKDARWGASLRKLVEAHRALARRSTAPEDPRPPSVEVARLAVEMETVFSGISRLRDLSDRSADAAASFGERLSAPIVAAALRRVGIAALAIDARRFVRTDDRHRRAAVDLPATIPLARRILSPSIRRGTIPVVTGFIAAGPDGRTTTLGRSGSDTTAAILGAALGAARIVIWTDVDGFLTADPRLVSRARLIPRLSYREAAELTYFGARVLHFPAMIPAIGARIPILIRNSLRPRVPGSIIGARGRTRRAGIAAVTAIRGLATVSLDGRGMVGVPGIAARAFSAVAREGVSVLMFSQASSEQNICLVVADVDRARSVRALREEFGPEIALRKLDGINVHGPVAAIAAVGEGMRGTPGIAARLFSAVAAARINVEAIAQGSSEVNISFIVEDRHAHRAVAAVHRLCRPEGR